LAAVDLVEQPLARLVVIDLTSAARWQRSSRSSTLRNAGIAFAVGGRHAGDLHRWREPMQLQLGVIRLVATMRSASACRTI
jgi:hypothetical protein